MPGVVFPWIHSAGMPGPGLSEFDATFSKQQFTNIVSVIMSKICVQFHKNDVPMFHRYHIIFES